MPTAKSCPRRYPLLLTFCVSVLLVVASSSDAVAQSPAKTHQGKKIETTEELTRKAKKLAHDLRMAELKLKVAQLDARIANDDAESSVRKAERELELAKSMLDHFDKFIAPARLAEARIALDSAENRATQARDEYDELVAMYKQEDFAEMTKELVLKRGRHNMDIAKRRLKIQKDKYLDLKKTILPRERAALLGKLDDARSAAGQAALKREKARLQALVTVQEAEHRLESSKGDLEEVRTRLARRVKK